jgi:hypothetical protein
MDGTEVVVAADPAACGGLPIQTTMTVRGRTVTMDALGTAICSRPPRRALDGLVCVGD